MIRKDILRPFNHPSVSEDPQQIKRFDYLAREWWNPKGKFKPVQDFNAERLGYIKDLCDACLEENNFTHIGQLKILDIGCGAGIVSEPLAKLGAQVTGIDASEQSIHIARQHATQNNIVIEYHCSTPVQFQPKSQFYLVLSLEVVEHVQTCRVF